MVLAKKIVVFKYLFCCHRLYLYPYTISHDIDLVCQMFASTEHELKAPQTISEGLDVSCRVLICP